MMEYTNDVLGVGLYRFEQQFGALSRAIADEWDLYLCWQQFISAHIPVYVISVKVRSPH